VSGDICDWLAKEEADAEQWGGLGGAQFYREQFAAARAEIERLRAAGDALAEVALLAVVCCRDNEVEQCNRAYAAWQEARRASMTGGERYFAARLANPEYRQAYEEAVVSGNEPCYACRTHYETRLYRGRLWACGECLNWEWIDYWRSLNFWQKAWFHVKNCFLMLFPITLIPIVMVVIGIVQLLRGKL
jgi:hypothetical protein